MRAAVRRKWRFVFFLRSFSVFPAGRAVKSVHVKPGACARRSGAFFVRAEVSGRKPRRGESPHPGNTPGRPSPANAALQHLGGMMGSFRRPRPRFMSSPVLSDLARFHTSTYGSQISNTTVWNRVQSAVVRVFQGKPLQNNELYSLNESIRWLLKTEMGSFITEYFQNQLLPRGLSGVLDQILHSKDAGEAQLVVLAEAWSRFFTETLPTLQAIFYPVQGQELTVRQMSLLAFRDLVLLKLHLVECLSTAGCVPPGFIQMLLVLQGVHEPEAPSGEYVQLERLVETVVSPYVCNVIDSRDDLLPADAHHRPAAESFRTAAPVTQHPSDPGCLSPLVEKEGEVYLEKAGGVRRHTVANAHSDVHLLLVSSRMHAGRGGASGPPAGASRPDEEREEWLGGKSQA